MGKLTKLASELGISILYYSNLETENAIGRYTKRYKITQKNKFQNLEIWESILDRKNPMEKDDLLLFISSRRSGISYLSMMENLPAKLEEKYSRNSKIIIYP